MVYLITTWALFNKIHKYTHVSFAYRTWALQLNKTHASFAPNDERLLSRQKLTQILKQYIQIYHSIYIKI